MGPSPATHSSVALPATLKPPNCVVGTSEIKLGPIRRNVNVALLLTAPSVATTLPVCGDKTGDVLIVNFCVADPSGTITAVGGTAFRSVSLNDTEVPPGGAGPDSVTVPVTVLHPATLPLLSVRELSWMPVSDVNT